MSQYEQTEDAKPILRLGINLYREVTPASVLVSVVRMKEPRRNLSTHRKVRLGHNLQFPRLATCLYSLWALHSFDVCQVHCHTFVFQCSFSDPSVYTLDSDMLLYSEAPALCSVANIRAQFHGL